MRGSIAKIIDELVPDNLLSASELDKTPTGNQIIVPKNRLRCKKRYWVNLDVSQKGKLHKLYKVDQ